MRFTPFMVVLLIGSCLTYGQATIQQPNLSIDTDRFLKLYQGYDGEMFEQSVFVKDFNNLTLTRQFLIDFANSHGASGYDPYGYSGKKPANNILDVDAYHFKLGMIIFLIARSDRTMDATFRIIDALIVPQKKKYIRMAAAAKTGKSYLYESDAFGIEEVDTDWAHGSPKSLLTMRVDIENKKIVMVDQKEAYYLEPEEVQR